MSNCCGVFGRFVSRLRGFFGNGQNTSSNLRASNSYERPQTTSSQPGDNSIFRGDTSHSRPLGCSPLSNRLGMFKSKPKSGQDSIFVEDTRPKHGQGSIFVEDTRPKHGQGSIFVEDTRPKSGQGGIFVTDTRKHDDKAIINERGSKPGVKLNFGRSSNC